MSPTGGSLDALANPSGMRFMEVAMSWVCGAEKALMVELRKCSFVECGACADLCEILENENSPRAYFCFFRLAERINNIAEGMKKD